MAANVLQGLIPFIILAYIGFMIYRRIKFYLSSPDLISDEKLVFYSTNKYYAFVDYWRLDLYPPFVGHRNEKELYIFTKDLPYSVLGAYMDVKERIKEDTKKFLNEEKKDDDDK